MQKMALINSVQSEEYLDACVGLINEPVFYYYDSLVRLSVPDLATGAGLLKVENNQVQLIFAQRQKPRV